MKIALCTTTINIPHALKLLRACNPDVRFFVALDKNTPETAAEFALTIPNTQVIPVYAQEKWKCSETLGWNCIARRNTVFLAALEWGADLIISHDDDNIPTGNDGAHTDYFARFAWALGHPFNGIKVIGKGGWFDPGELLIPRTRHRGIPWNNDSAKLAEPVTDIKIGVAAGLVIGDPDIDATTRIEKSPDIGAVHLLGQTGVVVDPHAWTVFNSQNTAVIRELLPAWFMMPGIGRHDDIFASLIVQRVARERNLHVHFGPPFTYQQRNSHDLIKDLRAEIDGMENVAKLAALLDTIILPVKSVIEDVAIIYSVLRYCDFLPIEAVNAGLLWIEDVGSVL